MILSHTTAGKGDDLSAYKNDLTILAVWRHGEMDTLDIARRFSTTEAQVYRIISARPVLTPYQTKAPYAGSVLK